MGAPSFKTWSNNTQQVREPTNTFKTQTVFIIFCMKTKKSFHGMARGSHWRGIRSPNLPTATRGSCFTITRFISHHVLSEAVPSLQHSVALGGCPSGHHRLVQAAQRLEASSSQRSPRYTLCLEARQSDVAKARLKVPTRAAVPCLICTVCCIAIILRSHVCPTSEVG